MLKLTLIPHIAPARLSLPHNTRWNESTEFLVGRAKTANKLDLVIRSNLDKPLLEAEDVEHQWEDLFTLEMWMWEGKEASVDKLVIELEAFLAHPVMGR